MLKNRCCIATLFTLQRRHEALPLDMNGAKMILRGMGNSFDRKIRTRLFECAALEAFTVFPVKAFVATWSFLLPLIAWAGWGTASLANALGLLVAGIISWSLFEYAAHRHVFHWTPNSGWGKRLVHLFHGNHHDVPNDALRNLMPPVVSLPVAGLAWTLSFLLLGPGGTWFFLGFMCGYVSYDLLHFCCHQAPMENRILKAFKRHHMRHHFSASPGNYAITGLVWDRVFGTCVTNIRRRVKSSMAEEGVVLSVPEES